MCLISAHRLFAMNEAAPYLSACPEKLCIDLLHYLLLTRFDLHAQSVWSGQKRMIGTFLHSPMLDELKSLETILMEKVCDWAHICRRSAQS